MHFWNELALQFNCIKKIQQSVHCITVEIELKINVWTAIKGQGSPLDGLQCHPLYRTDFGQYQASSAALGWPGFWDCYPMHRIHSNGWPYYECDKQIRMCILQSFKLGTQSIIEIHLLHDLYWPFKLLTWFYFTIYAISNYTYCNLKWEKRVDTRLLNTFPNPFPVYKLPVHTNVDTDTLLRRSF